MGLGKLPKVQVAAPDAKATEPRLGVKDLSSNKKVQEAAQKDSSVKNLVANIDSYEKTLRASFNKVAKDHETGSLGTDAGRQDQLELAANSTAYRNQVDQLQSQLKKLGLDDPTLTSPTTDQILSQAGSDLNNSAINYTSRWKDDGNQVSYKVTAQIRGAEGLAQATSESVLDKSTGKSQASSSSTSVNGATRWAATDGTSNISGGKYDAANGATKFNNLISGSNVKNYSAQDRADAYLYAKNDPLFKNINLSTYGGVNPQAKGDLNSILQKGDGADASNAATNTEAYTKLVAAFS